MTKLFMYRLLLAGFLTGTAQLSAAGSIEYSQDFISFAPYEESSEFSPRIDTDIDGLDVEIERGEGVSSLTVIFERSPATDTVALSPFNFPENSTPYQLDFSRPITDFFVRMGDYGQDSPDELNVRALAGNTQFDDDSATILTEPPGSTRFASERLSINNGKDVTGDPAIDTIEMIGGSHEFPNSVYYDKVAVGISGGEVSAPGVAKAQDTAILARDIIEDYSPVARMGLTFSRIPCANPASCGAKAVGIGALGVTSLVTGSELTSIVDDPPRNDYDLVFNAEPVDIPESIPADVIAPQRKESFEDGVRAIIAQGDLLKGWLITLERRAGAILAGEMEAAATQERKLESLLEAISMNAKTVERFAQALPETLEDFSTSVSQAEVLESKRLLSEGGFSAEVKTVLSDLGLSEADIQAIRSGIMDTPAEEILEPDDGFKKVAQLQSELAEVTRCSGAGCIIERDEIDTPLGRFVMEIEALFSDPEAILEVFIDGQSIGSVAAKAGDGMQRTYSLLVEDPDLFALRGAPTSVFVRENTVGGVLIGDIRTAAADQSPAPIPLPSSALLLACGIGAFSVASRRRISQA